MKFLLYQDVYELTARFLIQLGCEVLRVKQLGFSTANDEALLTRARADGCVFVTRDRDFGNLVFVQGYEGGVLYLRILPDTINAVHDELKRVLEEHSDEELIQSFVTVEPGRHRIRKVPGN